MEKCPRCGSTHLLRRNDSGETVCGNCGLVIQDVTMDEGPEWRAFTQEEKASRSRVGIPTSYSVHDKGLSTSIDRIDRDAFGHKLPLSTRLKMRRLRKWQIRSRVHSSIDRNLVQAMTELDRLSDEVSAPAAVKEEAALIYRKALDEGLVRGRSITAIAAASLYAACRINRVPRSLREISKAGSLSEKDISRCYRLLLRRLNLHVPTDDPLIHISKIAQKAGIKGPTETLVARILKNVKKRHVLAGKRPKVVAAAALYIACLLMGEKKTQRDIADAANISEGTLSNSYRSLARPLLQSVLSLCILLSG